MIKNLSSNYLQKYDNPPDLFSFRRNKFKKNDLKLEMLKIAQENLNMYKRLLNCRKSNYSQKKFVKEYKQSQYYKKNKCKYPSIDFYKEQRISNYFATIINPKNESSIFNNNNLFAKKHLKLKMETPYEKLFFKKKNHNFNNQKSYLVLDEVNINNNYSKRKTSEYFKTLSLIRNNNNNKNE
jgi:hypothetical protein